MTAKKTFTLVLAIAATFAFGSCKNEVQENPSQPIIDSLNTALQEKDEAINELFDVLTQIEDNLSTISAKYSNVRNMSSGVERGQNVRGQISSQLADIESMMADNKQKINTLNARITAMGQENTRLQEFVTRLEERMAEQESQISTLQRELEGSRATIRNLNDNVAALTEESQQKDEVIANQAAEANKAYFVIGTYNELKQLGIVTKTGGVLGMGRTQNLTQTINTEHFTLIDRTKVTTIAINKKKVNLISVHPEGSYELVNDEENPSVVAFLKILNPALFWKNTSYLVISTK